MTAASPTPGRTACFFARVPDPRHIETIEFYAQDVGFLRDLGYQVRIVTRVLDLLREPAADLYFCWWWTWALFPVTVARLRRRPAIVTGTFNHHLFRGRPAHQRRMIAWAARHASANVFVSRLERDEVSRMIPGMARASFSPHTVDMAAYRPGTLDRAPDMLLTVAHLDGGNSVRKCVHTSIHALARLAPDHPRLRLVVAGEKGSDYPALAQLADSLGVGGLVEFPGRISRDEKIRLMQQCTIYLQPSVFEGFGLAGLEAMACGAPVVTSAVGAVPEVGGDTVLYVNGEDPAAIARAVASLLSDDARRGALGRAARQRAEREFPLERRRNDLAAVIGAIGSRS